MAMEKRQQQNRKKVCRFCADPKALIDYKDVRLLGNFITDRGKIIPRRISGNCAMHQREVQNAVKRARVLALVPFSTVGI